jgi:hypothetical protein
MFPSPSSVCILTISRWVSMEPSQPEEESRNEQQLNCSLLPWNLYRSAKYCIVRPVTKLQASVISRLPAETAWLAAKPYKIIPIWMKYFYVKKSNTILNTVLKMLPLCILHTVHKCWNSAEEMHPEEIQKLLFTLSPWWRQCVPPISWYVHFYQNTWLHILKGGKLHSLRRQKLDVCTNVVVVLLQKESVLCSFDGILTNILC